MTTYKIGSIWTLMDIVHGRDACRDPGPLNYLLKFCPEWLKYNECNFRYNQSSANTVIYLPI